MRIKEIIISGYQILGEVHLEVPANGLWLVNGVNKDSQTCKSNGAGKSALLDTIFYALYEETVKKLAVGHMTNFRYAEEKKGMYVDLCIEHEGHTYNFIRSRGHAEYGTGFQIKADDVDLTTHIKKDMQAVFDSIITQTARQYRANTYIGWTMASRFTSLTDSQKKTVIEQAMTVESLERHEKRLNKLHADENVIYLNAVNIEEIACTEQRSAETTKLSLSNTRDEFNKTQEVKVIQLKDENLQLQELKIVSESRSKYIKNQSLLKVEQQLTQYMLAESAQKVLVDTDQLSLAQKIAEQNSLQALRTKHAALIADGKCVECGQSVASHLYSLKDEDRILEEFSKEIEKKRVAYRAAEEVNQGVLAKLLELRNAKATLTSKELAYAGDIVTKNTKIKENEELIKQYEAANPYDLLIQEQQDIIDARQLVIDAQVLVLKASKEKLEYYKLASQVFGDHGVRIVLLEHAIKVVNFQLNQICSQIGEGDILLQLDFKGRKTQKIDVIVPTQKGGYNALSDGERRFADFMIQLAIYSVSQTQAAPFLILDEVFQLIDNKRLEHIFHYLEGMALNKPIFVVTHNDYARAIIPNQLTMVREDGVSTLQEEE